MPATPREEDQVVSANLHKYTYPNRFYQWHLEVVMQRLIDFVDQAQPRSVLDAGCGEGFVAHFLATRRLELKITGVDLSEEAIEYARANCSDQIRFRTGSVYKLPFSDRSFDLVICSEVLEHLDDPDKAVRELRRVARGHVLITVPREPYFQWLNVIGQKIGVSVDPGHVNFWTKKSFQEFITKEFTDPSFDWKHIYQYALARV